MFGLHIADIVTIIVYFLLVIGIGIYANNRIKTKEDYFMGGRKFGKFVSIFLSFGVGTSSDTAISASRETYRMGMSGIWIQLLWLFVTPFYWIIAPWYRRLRVLTGGDYFQERFKSPTITGLYVGFSLLWLMFYIAIGLTAIGKTIEILTIKPDTALTQTERKVIGQFHEYKSLNARIDDLNSGEKQKLAELEEKSGTLQPYFSYLTTRNSVPVIALIILLYGLLGGLFAAAWTDTLQGVLILVLSFILLPTGLHQTGWFSGLHAGVPDSMFHIIGSESTSEYTWHYILILVIMNLVGVVAQPHIFSTGGGGAKDEMTARVGLVFGNFLKRFTTIMWAFTGIVAFVLFGDMVQDPDMIWGYATSQLLGPGFVGLMLACLLAAAMSSADAFMICGSALFTHNIYTPVFPHKTERHYVFVARLVSFCMIVGAITLSLYFNNILSLIKYVWQLPVIFGAVFWVSIYWRRLTKAAALSAAFYSLFMIVLLPNILPQISWVMSHKYASIIIQPNLFLLNIIGINVGQISQAWLMTINYTMDVAVPFILLFGISFLSRPPEATDLNRLFAWLRTPVTSDREKDQQLIQRYIQNPGLYDHEKLLPGSNWEIMKPDKILLTGFGVCLVLAVAILGFAFLISNIRIP